MYINQKTNVVYPNAGDDVEVDYRGYEVTVENLVRLLTGRLPESVPRYSRISIEGGTVLILVIRIRTDLHFGRPPGSGTRRQKLRKSLLKKC